MTNYVDADASGNIRAILNDSIDQIPAEAVAITQQQVDQWNDSRDPLKWSNGAFVVDTSEIQRRDGKTLLSQFDREIEKADLKVALLQMAWLTSQVLPLVDISSLPVQRQTRINTIIGRLDKLAAAFRAKKKAQTDIAGGTDPATIPIPAVDAMDD